MFEVVELLLLPVRPVGHALLWLVTTRRRREQIRKRDELATILGVAVCLLVAAVVLLLALC